MTGGALSRRARLYDRLPVTDDVHWWCDLAADAPGGRVLELGAGTGRLTAHLAKHAEVVAVDRDPSAIEALRRRTSNARHPVQGVVAELTRPGRRSAGGDAFVFGDRRFRFGLVALPTSLLNEIPTRAQRQLVVEGAAAHCHPDGRVAIALLNPLWLLTGGPSTGTIQGLEGDRVQVEAGHHAIEPWDQRARARLTYRFPDGERIDDELDAAAVFPVELELLLASVGLEIEDVWGAVPGDGPPAMDDGAWHVVARPTGRSPS